MSSKTKTQQVRSEQICTMWCHLPEFNSPHTRSLCTASSPARVVMETEHSKKFIYKGMMNVQCCKIYIYIHWRKDKQWQCASSSHRNGAIFPRKFYCLAKHTARRVCGSGALQLLTEEVVFLYSGNHSFNSYLLSVFYVLDTAQSAAQPWAGHRIPLP